MFIMFGLYYLCKKRKKPTKSSQTNQSEQLLAGFRYSGWWLWLKYSLLRFLTQYSLLHSNSRKHKYGSCTSWPTHYCLCYEKTSLNSTTSNEDLERQGDQLNNLFTRLVPKVLWDEPSSIIWDAHPRDIDTKNSLPLLWVTCTPVILPFTLLKVWLWLSPCVCLADTSEKHKIALLLSKSWSVEHR